METRNKIDFSFIASIVFIAFLAVISGLGIFISIKNKAPLFYLMLLIIALYIIAFMIYCKTKAGKEMLEVTFAKERKEKELETLRKKEEVRQAIYNQIYDGKPTTLDENQKFLFDVAFYNICEMLYPAGAKIVSLADGMTKEEVYTLWYERHTSAPIKAITYDGIAMNIDVVVNKNLSVDIPQTALHELSEHKPKVISLPKQNKKIPSNGVKKQRKRHRVAEQRKIEKKQQRIEAVRKRREARKRQPPNYEFIAKEWVTNNIGYVNRLLTNGIIPGEKFASARIPLERLPKDPITWNLIVKKLKEDGVICRYEVDEKGIDIKSK